MKTKIYIQKMKEKIRQLTLISGLLLVMNYGAKAQVNCVQLACPANINVNTDVFQCSAVVNYPIPTVTNSCCAAPTSVPGFTYLGTFDGHTYF
ncbi:MAG: hypothetical protein ABI855_08195, partial [Bacteroidota bacterium]